MADLQGIFKSVGLTVPADAVLDSGLKKMVFVDRGNGYFEPRRVETGWRGAARRTGPAGSPGSGPKTPTPAAEKLPAARCRAWRAATRLNSRSSRPLLWDLCG